MKRPLYTTLEIATAATPEQVKRAYRKQARRHHPDRGGSAERFQAVQLAYEILSDPERRARYDATGDTSLPRMAERTRPLQLLFALMGQVLQDLLSGAQSRQSDLCSALTHKLVAFERQQQELQRQGLRALALCQDAAARFTATEDGENLLRGMMEQHQRQVQAQLDAAAKELEVIAEARTILKRYRYTFEAQVAAVSSFRFGWVTATTTATGS